MDEQTAEPRAHFYATDVGRNDNGEMVAWTPVRCTCARPWRHPDPL